MSISEMFYNLGQALIDYIDRRISHVSSTESAIVVTRMNAHSLDTQVPSAKCVYDSLQNVDVSDKEDLSNKVTLLSAESTDTQYPSAKCVYDSLEAISESTDLTNYYTKEATDNLLDNKANTTDIPTTAAEVSALPDTTKYGAGIDLGINSATNVVTAILRDQNSAILGTGSVQIPVAEISGVTDGTYDNNTKIITFELENGNRIEVPATDLVPLVTIREWS